MIITLLNVSHTGYLRDFFFGALEKKCSGMCPICDGHISVIGLRLRKHLDLPIYRGKCGGECNSHFTFLPVFVAPGKWYDYFSIEIALLHVAQNTFSSTSAAIHDWDFSRDDLIADGHSPGPSASSVRRWWRELGQNLSERPWQARAEQELVELLPSAPAIITPQSSDPIFTMDTAKDDFTSTQVIVVQDSRSSSCLLLGTLRFLGATLIGKRLVSTMTSLLAIGMSFLETRFQQRCLAMIDLTGRVVPCPYPNMAATLKRSLAYPPETSPPP
ncbi:MAG: hypothetical protein HQM09_20520 [Candidatus Riflebacteria bacterium]|nr:hypothetical protein [Candidatus Riflebacteria bacterium]